jgi:FkbM family methyltransferase
MALKRRKKSHLHPFQNKVINNPRSKIYTNLNQIFSKLTVMKKLRQKIISAFKTYILRDRQLLEVRRWFMNNGDHTLRLDYPLREDSVVFDLGGYHGDFAASMVERYNCHVHVFEPMPEFARMCATRFAGNSKVRVLPFGLSSTNGEFRISAAADGSSIVRSNAATESIAVQVRAFAEYVNEAGVDKIDLMKINIEGGEYDVLPHVIAQGWIGRIAHLQIQFHDFVEGHLAKRDAIRAQLAATHAETWCYWFVWENWSIQAQADRH